jgi:hypothetical protein
MTEAQIAPPTKPGEWSIAQIEYALSRPLPGSMLKMKKRMNRKTGQATELPFIPWHTANKILSKYAPGWSGRVVSIAQVGSELVLTYALVIPTADGDVERQATGTEEIDHQGFGESCTNAESQAFRRCCARFGLGLYLYSK